MAHGLRQSSINRLWDVVDNTRRVIRFLVDIDRDVIRLVIWHVFTTGEVEGDIKEVYDLFVGFDRFLRPCLPKMLQRSFLTCSACRGDGWVIPRPSSLYKPKL